LSRDLANYDVWNDDSIKKRAEDLFSIANQVWFLPEKYNIVNSEKNIDYDVDYNIMDDLNVTGEKPRQLTICDLEYTVSSWKDVLRELCKQLYELDSQVFESFTKHKDFEGRDRRVISNDCDGMISPFQLAENIYIETNMSANSIINYCKLIAEKNGLQEDIYFRLRQ